jgi:hypothetical protein
MGGNGDGFVGKQEFTSVSIEERLLAYSKGNFENKLPRSER